MIHLQRHFCARFMPIHCYFLPLPSSLDCHFVCISHRFPPRNFEVERSILTSPSKILLIREFQNHIHDITHSNRRFTVIDARPNQRPPFPSGQLEFDTLELRALRSPSPWKHFVFLYPCLSGQKIAATWTFLRGSFYFRAPFLRFKTFRGEISQRFISFVALFYVRSRSIALLVDVSRDILRSQAQQLRSQNGYFMVLHRLFRSLQ